MKIYLIVQEIQSEHGYVDTTVLDAYTDEQMARVRIDALEYDALRNGELVAGRQRPAQDADEWTILYRVQEVTLHRAPEVR